MTTRIISIVRAMIGVVALWAGTTAAENLTNVVITSTTSWTDAVYDVVGTLTVSNGAELSISGGTVVNVEDSVLVAGSNSTILCRGANISSTNAQGQWAGIGVTINASNIVVAAGARISADGQGYKAGGILQNGRGPGGGGRSTGGSVGGGGGGCGAAGGSANGAMATGGVAYGDAFVPTVPGSAGGCGSLNVRQPTNSGGGAVRLTVVNELQLDGMISANGDKGNDLYYGGGSGGSLLVIVSNLTGSGSFVANGGNGGHPTYSGGGGGGRCAIYYQSSTFAGLTNSTVRGGTGYRAGQDGTIAFFDVAAPGTNLYVYRTFSVNNDTTCRFGRATADTGCTLVLGSNNVFIVNELVARDNARMEFGIDTRLDARDSVTITNGGRISLGGGVVVSAYGVVRVCSNGMLVCQSRSVSGTNAAGQWTGSGVTIDASNMVVEAGGRVSADGQGYGAAGMLQGGKGPGGGRPSTGGSAGGGGGGHGNVGGFGNGSMATGGMFYGDAFMPTMPGSAGGCGSINIVPPTNSGGGAVRLTVINGLQLDGMISANGDNGNDLYYGGGSGGSLLVTVSNLTGSGAFVANGGNGGNMTYSGGGGGGRVAVYYLISAFTGLTNSTARGGTGYRAGADGTIAFFDVGVPGTNMYVYRSFGISDGTTSRFARTIADTGGTLVIGSNAVFAAGEVIIGNGARIECGGDSRLTADSLLFVSNSTQMVLGGGSLVKANNEFRIGSNGTVVCQGRGVTGTNALGQWAGGGVTIDAADLMVELGGRISADGQGYGTGGMMTDGKGPGGGTRSTGGSVGGGGGGHGGAGGFGNGSTTTGGVTYGDAFLPAMPGSAGGCGTINQRQPTNAGGGMVHLSVANTLQLDGIISASGDNGNDLYYGGGSGGSLWVRVTTLAGNGSFVAKGGNGGHPNYSGGGGGGRVAIYYQSSTFAGLTNSTARGGTGYRAGQDGSIAFFDISVPGTNMYVYSSFSTGGGTTNRCARMIADTSSTLVLGSNSVFVADQLTIRNGARLESAVDTRLTVGTVLLVSNASQMVVGGGSLVTVQGELHIGSNAVVLCQGRCVTSTNALGEWVGGGVNIDASNMVIEVGGQVSANGQGYVTGGTTQDGKGPGGGRRSTGGSVGGGGGGYGGAGGFGNGAATTGGIAYGDAWMPLLPGSAGGCGTITMRQPTNAGGGVVCLTVFNALQLDGTISANGDNGNDLYYGGGSGGSLLLAAYTLAGNGSLVANGGNGGNATYAGGGGGGRIAVYFTDDAGFAGPLHCVVAPGTGYRAGSTGTVVYLGAPVVDITNDYPQTLSYDITNVPLAGTNNASVFGAIYWSNLLDNGNGPATRSAPESNAWTIAAVSLAVGSNEIHVIGTNAWHRQVSSNNVIVVKRGGIGTGAPFLDVTTTAALVSYDLTGYTVAGTNNPHVMGTMVWSNELTGAGGTVAAGASWGIGGIALDVGSNVITVSGTNAWNVPCSDSVIITRGGIGTGAPFLDVTTTPALVSYDFTSYAVAGTNNQHIVGGLWWTNGLNGATGSVQVSSFEFQVSNIPLSVGTNAITVYGTNAWNVLTNDTVVITRGPAGTGIPFLDVTSATATVTYETTTHSVAGTNNVNTVGGMWASNAANAATARFTATVSWTASAISLNVGQNPIMVVGTNAFGVQTNDTVVITRMPPPAIGITNPGPVSVIVPYSQMVYRVVATNVGLAGDICVVVNHATTNAYPGTDPFSCDVALKVGPNLVIMTGTNSAGVMARDTVMINRRHYRGAPVAWGYNANGQTNCPVREDLVMISAGYSGSLALSTNGTLVAWGNNNYGQTNCPAGMYRAVAAGWNHNIALRENGSLVAWGYWGQGRTNCPSGTNYAAIAGGSSHSIALRTDGSLVGWGDNFQGQTTVPPGTQYVAIAAGDGHNIALKNDGSLVGWGRNLEGEINCPAGNDYIAVAAGTYFSLALRANGTIIGWGDNGYGQINCPAGSNYVAISANGQRGMALRSDGTLVSWGGDWYGETNCPPGHFYAAMAAGMYHGLALRLPAPALGITNPPVAYWVVTNDVDTFTVVATNNGIAGGMGVSVNGGTTNWQAPSAPFITNIALAVGETKITLVASNDVGGWAQADAVVLRAGPPYIDITTTPTRVDNEVASFVLQGTNNIQIVGRMWASNAANAVVVALPASVSWTTPEIPLAIGANQISVFGTNAFGIETNDTVGITRSPALIVITNPAAVRAVVPYAQTSYVIVATNTDIVGAMGVIVDHGATNWYAAANPFVCTVPLNVGPNLVRIMGTNEAGWSAWDAVLIVRRCHEGRLVAWGAHWNGETNCPPGTDYCAAAGGDSHSIALSAAGSLVAWGVNWYEQTNCPPGTGYTDIAAGGNHTLAVAQDGALVGWGQNWDGQATCPPGAVFVAVAGGANHSIALRADGTLVGWGANWDGQTNCPPGNKYVAISTRYSHNLALTMDGTVVGWGANGNGETNCPPGVYRAVAAGQNHCIAQEADGSLVGWGANWDGQTSCPAGTGYREIAAGDSHSLALRTNGSLVAWGSDSSGQTDCPASNDYVAVAGGGSHSIAIQLLPPVIEITNPPVPSILVSYDETPFSVVATFVNVEGSLGVSVDNGPTNWHAASSPFATNISLNVGPNSVAVMGANAAGVWNAATATIIRGVVGTGRPFVDITTTPVTVSYDVSNYVVGGTNNIHVMGGLWVSNTANGAAAPFAASASWAAPALSLVVGSNTFIVSGTNMWGRATNDTVVIVRGGVGTGAPCVDMTNVLAGAVPVLSYDATNFVASGTNNQHVVGMWVTNLAMNGAHISVPVGLNWTAPAIGLVVGTNWIGALGTNEWGSGSASWRSVYRGGVGTGRPFLDVTNAPAWVPNDVPVYTIGGTNTQHVVGWLWWTNGLNGATGSVQVSSFEFQVSNIPLGVGTNTIVVFGTNAWNVLTNDAVMVERGPVGTGTPFLSITTTPVTVSHDMTNYVVAGTRNPQVVGVMQVTNDSAGGASLDFLALPGWTAPAMPLIEGTNLFRVTGTNAFGVATNDTVVIVRGPVGTGFPVLHVTNIAVGGMVLVTYDVTNFALVGTNNQHVVGGMGVSNENTGVLLRFPAALSWITPEIDLIVGTNSLKVVGTNAWDVPASSSRNVYRGPIGTGRPFLDITTTPSLVSYDVTNIVIAGTNNIHLVGTMWVSNPAVGGASAAFPASNSWTAPEIPLVVGTNRIWVFGTNAWNVLTNDSVIIERGDIGTGLPFVRITNFPAGTEIVVPNDVLTYVFAGTNNIHVMGDMSVSNWNMGGAAISFPASQSWTAPAISLGVVGTNGIFVRGSNLWNGMGIDGRVVRRGPVGTGTPFLDITTSPMLVSYDMTNYGVGGTNNIQVAGTMWVSNATVGGATLTWAATSSWTAPAIAINVGTNMIVVYGTNAWNVPTNDTVIIERGPIGTGRPFLDITNAAVLVSYDVTNYVVAGTNNAHVMGEMCVSNAANAAVAYYTASASWTTPPLPLAVGQNTLWVFGTNAWGWPTNDTVVIERGPIGTGRPWIAITNTPVLVSYDMNTYLLGGTNNSHVFGDLWVSNATVGGAAVSFAAAAEWTSAAIGVEVGPNIVVVYGTNVWGWVTDDTVEIERGPIGTGRPFLDITNTPVLVSYDVTNYVVGGTNNAHVMGGMWVSNAANAAVAYYTASASWITPALPLAVGQNTLWVFGTNAWGWPTNDTVVITRGPIGTGRPWIAITNTPVLVSYDMNTYVLGGTNNSHVCGDLWVSNATAGGAAVSFAASAEWTSAAIGIGVGTNVLVVYGTNVWGWETNATVEIERGPIGTGRPFLAVTNVPPGVAYNASTYSVAGTNNLHVMGDMWVSNETVGGDAFLFAAAPEWEAPSVDLVFGTNRIVVYGMNLWGLVTNDVVVIERTTTFIVITNPASVRVVVPYSQATYTIVATNVDVVGGMAAVVNHTLTNWYPAAYPFVATVELSVGPNLVQIIGTNYGGVLAMDAVLIERRNKEGILHAWGFNENNETNAPAGKNYVAIAGGGSHSIALDLNGSLVGWGLNLEGQIDCPVGMGYRDIAAGGSHSLAISPDGSVSAWGGNDWGQLNYPSGTDYVAVAAGDAHSIALRADGSLVGWGSDSYGQIPCPAGTRFLAITARGNHSLALTKDGTVVAWGSNDSGESAPPRKGRYLAVAAGGSYSLAQLADRSLVAWGHSSEGQTNCPPGSFSTISAGGGHSVALTKGRTLLAWGDNTYGQINCPTGDNYTAVAAGSRHSIALSVIPPILDITNPPVPFFVVTNDVDSFTVVATNNGIRGDIGVIINNGATNWQAATTPFLTNIALGTGANRVTLVATNEFDAWAHAEALIVRAGPPFIDITNESFMVNNRIQSVVISGTNNVQVLGRMWVSNATMPGAVVEFNAAERWTTPPIALAIGQNQIVVGGTNAFGVLTYDTLMIVRSTTLVIITNPVAVRVSVPFIQTNFTVVATNANIVGYIGVVVNGGETNWRVAENPFVFDVPLDSGPNLVKIIVTNVTGWTTWDAVMIVRRAHQGDLAGWGANWYLQTTCPQGTNYDALAAGTFHTLALDTQGSVVGWGHPSSGKTNCPSGFGYRDIAAGTVHSMALAAAGSLVAWGGNESGQIDVPPGNNYAAVAAGDSHSLALRDDGTLVAWGANNNGQTNCPPGDDYVAISAKGNHNVALTADGTLVGWGYNGNGETNCPAGSFINISAGTYHCLAQRADRTLVAWGNNEQGQADVPDGSDYVAIGAGLSHSLALYSNDSLTGWGGNLDGQIECPSSNRYFDIAAGAYHSIAIRQFIPAIIEITNPPAPSTSVIYDVPSYLVAALFTNVADELGVAVNQDPTNWHAAVTPFATNIALAVGTNIVVVTATNAVGVWASDSVTIIRGPPGNGIPTITITSTPALVSYDMASYAVAGTNNVHVVGTMWASNTANHAVEHFGATTSWTASAVAMLVGTNTIWVCGTNALGWFTNDTVIVERGPAGTGRPFIAITTTPMILSYDITSYSVVGTNNANVVGTMWITNASDNAAAQSFPAAESWAAPSLPLNVGTNFLCVYGTNSFGDLTNDVLIIMRGPLGTGVPFLDLTNAPLIVSFETLTCIVAGTNNDHVVGDMWASNAATAVTIKLAASASWVTPAILLNIGTNEIMVFGTNAYGTMANDSVTITRTMPEPFLDVTNAAVTLPNDIPAYAVAGTNNVHVVGTMWATNTTAGGTSVTFAAAAGWTAPSLNLNVGTNMLLVYGTNLYGALTNDAVVITRGPIGTGTPFVNITNDNDTVASNITSYTIEGTNNEQVVGTMSWTNIAAHTGGTLPATLNWAITNIPLAPGVNEIVVSGSNLWGGAATDTISIVRIAGDPADVLHFQIGRGADYGQVRLSWSNAAITVLACTNSAYTTTRAEWFVLSSAVSTPWTHTAASNFPSVYYRIISGIYTSRYDVGKFDVSIAPGSIAWLSFPFAPQLGCDTVGEWFGQQLEARYNSLFDFPSLQWQDGPGGTIQNSDYCINDFVDGSTNWFPDTAVVANEGYILFLPGTHPVVKLTAIGMVQTNNVSLRIPYASVPWIGLAYPLNLDMKNSSLADLFVPAKLYSSFDYDFVDSQVTPGGSVRYAEYYSDNWGGGTTNFFPSVTGADKIEPGKGYLIFFSTARGTGTGTWTCVRPY